MRALALIRLALCAALLSPALPGAHAADLPPPPLPTTPPTTPTAPPPAKPLSDGAPAMLVETPASGVYEARIDGPQAALWIALQPKVPATSLTVSERPLDVSVGNRHELPLVQAFTASWHGEPAAPRDPSADALSRGIKLQIDVARLPGPGTYDVALGLQEQASGPAPRRQTLRLQISVPAAVLRAKSALVVERVLALWSNTTAAQTVAHPLILAETGGKSYALLRGAVSIVSESPQVATVDGELRVDTNQPVPRDGAVPLKVSTQGTFPLGSVRGSLELQSSQLAAPTLVPFEVRTRRARVLIVVLIVLGLLMGLLTRTVLTARIALGEQRVKLAALRERLDQEAQQQPDRLTRDKLTALRRSLDDAQSLDEPQTILTRLSEAEATRTQIHEALQAARSAAESRLQALQKQIPEYRTLPPSALAVLDAASQHLAEAETKLKAGEVSTASAQINAAEARMRHDLQATLRAWLQQVTAELETLEDRLPPLRPRDHEKLSSRRQSLRTATDQLGTSLDQPGTDLATLLLHALLVQPPLRNLCSALSYGLKEALQTVRSDLATLALPPPPALLQLAAVQPDSSDASADANYLPQLQRLIEQGRALAQALDEALRSVLSLPSLSPDRRRELTELVGQKAYLDALAKAVAWQREEQASRSASPPTHVLGTAAVTEASPGSLAPDFFPDDLSPAAARPLPIAAASDLAAAELPAPSAASHRRILRCLRILQLLFSGLGIAAIGYLLFEARFVGTVPELITIFFWGFSADISVDSLVSFSKGLRPPAAPANALPPIAAAPPTPATPPPR